MRHQTTVMAAVMEFGNGGVHEGARVEGWG